MRHIVLGQALFLWVIIASPVGAEWLFEYNVNYLGDGHAAGFSSATSGVGHARGVVAIGEDDFFFSNSGRPTQAQGNYNALIYRNCTGATDIPIILEPAWVNPTNPNDRVDIFWNWGVACDGERLYLANQDPEYSIVVYDIDGNPTPYRNELGFYDSNVYYPSQIAVDASGHLYVANYGYAWVPDGGPSVGNIVWYPSIAEDPNWAADTARPHNPAPLGVYSAIQGATDPSAYDNYFWVCEGLDVNPDGSMLAYTCRYSESHAGVYVATGDPASGYVLAASNDLTGYLASISASSQWNIRGCDIGPDQESIYVVCMEGLASEPTEHDLIAIWNWQDDSFQQPVFLSTPNGSIHRRPPDAEVCTVPYDVDVYSSEVPGRLNLIVAPFYKWQMAAKYVSTGEIPDRIRQTRLWLLDGLGQVHQLPLPTATP